MYAGANHSVTWLLVNHEPAPDSAVSQLNPVTKTQHAVEAGFDLVPGVKARFCCRSGASLLCFEEEISLRRPRPYGFQASVSLAQ